MKALLEFMVKALVDYPGEVVVKETAGARVSIFEVRLNDSDYGKVVGKQGRNINALRQVIQSIASKTGKRASIELIGDPKFDGGCCLG